MRLWCVHRSPLDAVFGSSWVLGEDLREGSRECWTEETMHVFLWSTVGRILGAS